MHTPQTFRRCLILVASLALASTSIGDRPAWWLDGDPPVVTGASESNHGPANIGQAKHMAKSALETIRLVNPAIASQIEADLVGPDKPIPNWNPPTDQPGRDKNRAPLLIGQLKAIAHPFYNHLNTFSRPWVLAQIQQNHPQEAPAVLGTHYWQVTGNPNYTESGYYPWNPAALPAANRTIATIGQLKSVFSLRYESLPFQGQGPTLTLPATLNATEGLLFTHTVSSTGSPVTFSSNTLPSDITLHPTTGVLQGTPSLAGSYPLEITVSNSHGSASAVSIMTVAGNKPVITSPLSVTAAAGKFFQYEITANNNPTSLSINGDLPPGLSFSQGTAIVSGILTDESVNQFSIQANTMGPNGLEIPSDTKTVTLSFVAPPQITSSHFATATQGASFSFQITATNVPQTFAAIGLPAGLNVNVGTGLISGIPTTVGKMLVTVKSSNSAGTTEDYLWINVKPLGAPVLALPDKIYLTLGIPFSYQIQCEGLPGQFAAAGLPAGISLDSATGIISGTPTAIGTPEVLVSAVNSTASSQKKVIFVVMSPNKTANGIMKFQNGVSPSLSYQAYSAGVIKDTSDATKENTTFGGLYVGAPSNTENGRVLFGFPLSDLPTDAVISSVSLQLKGFSNILENSTVYPDVELRSVGAAIDWNGITWNSAPLPNTLPSISIQALSVINPSNLSFATNSAFVAQASAAASAGEGKELRLMLIAPVAENLLPAARPRSFNITGTRDPLAADRPELAIGYTTGAPPEFNLPSEWVIIKGVPQSLKIRASNDATSITAGGGIPAWLSFKAVTGTLSATSASVIGIYSVPFIATNSNGSGNRTLAVRVIDPPPEITSQLAWSFPSGSQSSYTITATNSPLSFAASNLPDGLVLDQSTGVISGTTHFHGTRNITILAANEAGSVAAVLALTAVKTTPVITSLPAAFGAVTDSFSYQIAATQSPTSYSCSELPGGLNLIGSRISGVPTQAGTFTVSISATNDVGTGSRQLQIEIGAPVPQLITAVLQGQVGQSFDRSLEFNNSPYNSSVIATGLPPGLSLDYPRIHGTPTDEGVYTVNVAAGNQYGNQTSPLTITILPALSLTNSTVQARVGEALSHVLTPAIPAWQLAVDGLPDNGLVYNGTSRTITGTPLTAGVMSIPVTITSDHGSGTVTFQIHVSAAATDLVAEFQHRQLPTSDYQSLIVGIATDQETESINPEGTFEVGRFNRGRLQRLLLGYDLSTLPDDIQITSASLTLQADATAVVGPPAVVSVYSPAYPFSSASPRWDHDNAVSLTPLTSRLLNADNFQGGIEFYSTVRLTNAVQKACEHASPLQLTVASPAAEKAWLLNSFGFYKSETIPQNNPKLVITYRLRPLDSPPEILYPYMVDGELGQPFSHQVKASHRPSSYSVSGNLPAGVTFSSATGSFSGTPTQVGEFPVQVTASNVIGSDSVTIELRIHQTIPITGGIEILDGNDQTAFVDTTLVKPLEVKVSDNGNPVSSALVVFKVQPGNGRIMADDGVSFFESRAVVTNAQGRASVVFKLPGRPGKVQVSATVRKQAPANQASVSFSATGILQSIDGLEDYVQLRLVHVSEHVLQPSLKNLEVQALDSLGTPITGRTLTITRTSGTGTVPPPSAITDMQGKVAFDASAGEGVGAMSSYAVRESMSGALLAIAVTDEGVTSTPDPGGIRLAEPDYDGDILGVDSFSVDVNGMDAVLHWLGRGNPDQYIIEWRTEGRNWQSLSRPGGNSTEYTDRNVKAGRRYHYRIFAVRDGELSKPKETNLFLSNVLDYVEYRSSYSNSQKGGCHKQYTSVVKPQKPKWYLKETLRHNDTFSMTTEDGSSQRNKIYMSSTAYMPERYELPNGGMNLDKTEYGGTYSYSTSDSWLNSSNQLVTNTLSEIAGRDKTTGGWSGSGQSYTQLYGHEHWRIISDPFGNPDYPWFPIDSTIVTPTKKSYTWSNNSATVHNTAELSEEYTTDKMIEDGKSSLSAPSNWFIEQSFYAYSMSPNADGSHKAYHFLDDNVQDGNHEYYTLRLYNYRLNFRRSFSENYKWLEVFVPQEFDWKYQVGDAQEIARLNSLLQVVAKREVNTSAGQSAEFTIDPRKSESYGRYILVPVEGIHVHDSGSHLDENEKKKGIDIVNGQSISFEPPTAPLPGSRYSLSWTASSSFSVYVTISGVEQELSSGRTTFDESEWTKVDTGSFRIVANENAPLGRDSKLSFKITHNGTVIVDDSFKVEIPDDRDFSVVVDEATGAQYRKIALNGTPLQDSKPQQEAESDSEPEETFVDALTLGLRHSTTDVYLPVPGSDLALSSRRDFTPEVWSERRGQRPQEDPQKPYGACWSTNLTPSIKFVRSVDPEPSEPDKAYVVDESGATHAFFVVYGDFRSTGVRGTARFFPIPSSKNQQTPNLASLDVDSSGSLVFSRKFGTTIRYESAGFGQYIQEDRLTGDGDGGQSVEYLRATTVTDRLGNILDYSYTDLGNLVPSIISVRNHPDLNLYIRQNDQGLITSIWDAKGNETKFDYVQKTYSSRTQVNPIWLLDKVTNADGSITKYDYEVVSEADQTPVPVIERSSQSPHWHCELKSITDPLQHKHTFAYEFDHSRMNYKNDVDGDYPGHIGYYVQTGLPRNIKSVTFPNNTVSTFQNNSKVWIGVDSQDKYTASGQRESVVTDTQNFSRTYSFDQTTVVPIPEVKISYPENRSFSEPLLVVYQKMSIQHGNHGSESFEFDLNAAMALKKVTDFCGNTTTFAHEEAWNTEGAVRFRGFLDPTSTAYSYYSDPTSQTNAQNKTKYYTYTPESRLMKSVTDENGRFTEYTFDGLGRRTREIVYSSSSRTQKLKDTVFSYGDSRFPGFMTSQTSYPVAGSSDPAWVTALVTEYVPDANGRVAEEIVDPRGLRLVTKSTYDKNGNKLTSTDPRGNTTWFTYDSRNRITRVMHADGTYSRTTYDARSNKVIVADENKQLTGFEYDALGRVVTQIQDLNGDLSYNPATNHLDGVDAQDLVSSFTYNNLGSKLSVTDSRGFTTVMRYDELQRLTKTIQPKAHRTAPYIPTESSDDVTTFDYDRFRNCGGTAFDSSGFKPTRTVDPRGYLTTVTYDSLYRPQNTRAQYQLSPPLFANSSTQYDYVGNVTATVDPLSRRTETDYDGLNRPTVTRAAVTMPGQINPDYGYTQTFYTSTGFAWKQRDQEGRVTTSQYDAAGRVRFVTSPLVDRGDGTLASAVTETIYDAAGNPAATINPLGKRWDSIYNSRNRKIYDQQPAVFDQLSGETLRPTTSTVYDATGKVIKTTDAKGNTAHTLYDRANRPTHTISPAAPVTLADGTVSTLCTVSRMEYDKNGNVLRTTRGGIASASTLLSATNPYEVALTETLITAENTYDALNRLATTMDAANITVGNEYDASGNLTAVTDGKNQRTRFTYDGFKRNTSIIDPAQRSTIFEYNALNKTARVDSKNQRTEYSYDAVNRLKTVSYIDRAQDNRSYTYDKVGNLCAVSESKGDKTNIAYAYDAMNRQIRENQGAAHAATLVPQGGALPTGVTGGLTHHYKYDLAGNRLHTIYGGTNRTITSAYDALNRLDTLAEGGRSTTYRYDLNGGVAKLTHPNNDTIEKSFDSLGRATSITTRTAGTTHLSTYSHGYNLAGNCRKIVEDYAPGGLPDRTVINTYDFIDRLTHEAVTTGANTVITQYQYDNGNNRTAKFVTAQPPVRTVYTNNLNQADYHYTDSNGNSIWDSGETKTTYLHDYNGNRTSATKSTGASSTTDNYSYDYENRLTGIVKATPGPDLQTGTFSYIYDYRTRRVERNESAAGGVVTRLVFSGGTSVQEYNSVSAVPAVEFIRGSDYGGGIGGILYSLRGGSASFTHYNNRGDVVAKTNSGGALTFQASYEAYGKRTAAQGSTADRQKANTKDEDPTGLLNEGFRYRDLDSGTFITRDPLGFVDGPNVYTYVRQNPWTAFDPRGLAEKRVTKSGYEVKGTGHHLNPVELWDKQGFTDSGAQNILDKATIDAPDHNYTGHGSKTGYTAQVEGEFDAFKTGWLEKNKIVTDSAKLTAKQQQQLAQDFIDHIKPGGATTNKFIQGFNKAVGEGPLEVARFTAGEGKSVFQPLVQSEAKYIATNGKSVPYLKYVHGGASRILGVAGIALGGMAIADAAEKNGSQGAMIESAQQLTSSVTLGMGDVVRLISDTQIEHIEKAKQSTGSNSYYGWLGAEGVW